MMSQNELLMDQAKGLNLTYEQVYTELPNIFPVLGEYVGSLANHFRGKLKDGTVDRLIEAMDNYCLNKLIKHFTPKQQAVNG